MPTFFKKTDNNNNNTKPKQLVFIKSSVMLIYLLSLLWLSSQPSLSTTVHVDGISEWKNPTVHVGDSIIFKHRYHYKLYIFQNQIAFNLCNFTQATLLSKPNSTSFTWHPSRTGFFYFTFNNGSLKGCQDTQFKLAINVSPELPPVGAPAPTSGGSLSSPVRAPPLVSDKGGGGIPIINSNPAVTLPTGEVDSATIRPLPTSGHGAQVVPAAGLYAVQMAVFCVVLLLL